MSQKKTAELAGYLAMLGGLAMYILWLLRVRTVFAQQSANLPVDSALLPSQLIYWIAIVLIIIPFTIQGFSRPVRLASLFLALFLMLFAFPLHAPYNLPYARDPQYALQAAEVLKDSGFWSASTGTGQARGYSDFPGLPIYHVLLSSLSGLSLTQAVLWGMGIFRLAIFPLLLFVFFRAILKNAEHSLLAVFIYFTNPSLTNHPHYEGMAIVYAVALVFLVFLGEYRNSWRAVALCAILAAATVFTHHFTSYVLFAWLLFLAGFAFSFRLLHRIPAIWRLPHQVFTERVEWRKPLAVFMIFAVLLGGWSVTYGKFHYQFYAASLNNAVVDIIFPDSVANTQASAIRTRILLPSTDDSVLSFAEPGIERPQQVEQPPPPEPNPVLQSVSNVWSQLRQGNFKLSEIAAIALAMLAVGAVMIIGLRAREREATFIEVGDLLFFGAMTLAGFLLVVVARYNIISRMFEFTYLGFVTFIVAGLVWVLGKPTLARQVAFTVCAVMFLIAGNLLVSSGQQRAFYVPQDKVTLDSSQMFLTPATVEMTSWVKDNFRGKDGTGEAFIFDTVGAYGQVQIHYYEPDLIRGVYQSLAFSDQTRLKVRYDNVQAIFTHKYLSSYGSLSGGPYPPAAQRKLDDVSWLTRAYDSNILQTYYVREYI